MAWSPINIEDVTMPLNGLKPTMRQFEQENQHGLATLRPRQMPINLDLDDDEDSTDCTKNDANVELRLKAYRMSLIDKIGKMGISNNEEEDMEITKILRKSGQDRISKDYRLDSKTTSRTAISTDGLPVAGVKNLFITNDHFKFVTPLTYGNLPASNICTTKVEATTKPEVTTKAEVSSKAKASTKAKATTDVSTKVMQRNYQHSITKKDVNQITRQSLRRYEEPSIGVPGEEFCTPRQLYCIRARQNR